MHILLTVIVALKEKFSEMEGLQTPQPFRFFF